MVELHGPANRSLNPKRRPGSAAPAPGVWGHVPSAAQGVYPCPVLRSAGGLCVTLAAAWAIAPAAHAGGSASGVKVVATITPGQVRLFKPVGVPASAGGTFEEVVDPASHTAVWKLTFTGMTGKVTEARVTYITRPKAGSVVSHNNELCAPCLSGASGVDHFPQQADATAFLAEVRRGDAQVVLYTAKNAKNGEIAGTLRAAGAAKLPPTPASTGTPTARASASYANGKVTLTFVVGRAAEATVIVSDRGKPPFTSDPIELKTGTTTVVIAHRFLTRGYHYGIVNVVFAGGTRHCRSRSPFPETARRHPLLHAMPDRPVGTRTGDRRSRVTRRFAAAHWLLTSPSGEP